MAAAHRPFFFVSILAILALQAAGCGLRESSGFDRATYLALTRDSEIAQHPSDGEFSLHGGVARRAWRTTESESLVVSIGASPGTRFEISVARAGEAPVRARIRVDRGKGDLGVQSNDLLTDGDWHTATLDLSAYAGQEITLRLDTVSTVGASAAIDWGEPILLEHTGRQTPKNIVLITLDTTRADVAADPRVAPHLAELAQRGVTFSNAWSAATSTTASHASILTGLPVEQHGSVSNRSDLAGELTTLAEALSSRGYQTAASVTVDHIGYTVGFGQGFGRFRPAARGDAADGATSIDTVTDWLGAFAGDDARPFFLFVHLFDPHTPYGPPHAFITGELARRGFSLPPPTATPATVPIFPGRLPTPLAWLEGITNRARVEALYRNGVAYADHLAGRVIDRISELGLAEDTVMIVTSDHGEALGEQGVFYQHAGLWPASLRVPLVVAGPGWPSDTLCRARASGLDIFASLVAVADDRIAEAPLRRLADLGDPGRRVWFAETRLAQLGFRDAEVHYAEALGPGQFGVRVDPRPDGPHVRAIQRYTAGTTWLFDVNQDPELQNNLAGQGGAGLERYHALVRDRARGSAARIRQRQISAREEAELRALGYAEE